MEHQRARFQFRFELFLIECNCLVVVVRTYDFEIQRSLISLLLIWHSAVAPLDQLCQFLMVARACSPRSLEAPNGFADSSLLPCRPALTRGVDLNETLSRMNPFYSESDAAAAIPPITPRLTEMISHLRLQADSKRA